MLLWNISLQQGLCNGTRMKITNLHNTCIEAELIKETYILKNLGEIMSLNYVKFWGWKEFYNMCCEICPVQEADNWKILNDSIYAYCLYMMKCTVCFSPVLLCRGNHVCFTRRRSRVRNSPEPFVVGAVFKTLDNYPFEFVLVWNVWTHILNVFFDVRH